MSILLVLVAIFFAVVTVWAGCRLHRLLSRRTALVGAPCNGRKAC